MESQKHSQKEKETLMLQLSRRFRIIAMNSSRLGDKSFDIGFAYPRACPINIMIFECEIIIKQQTEI